MSSKVLAFINFKGGVGKTATVVNIGATLAKLHEKKVLIVDLDPQSNASVWLMRPDRWREHVAKGRRSTFQIFDDALHGKPRFNFEEALVQGVVTWTGFTDLPRLHLLPASVELLRIERQNSRIAGPGHLSNSGYSVRLAFQRVRLCPVGLSTKSLRHDESRDFLSRWLCGAVRPGLFVALGLSGVGRTDRRDAGEIRSLSSRATQTEHCGGDRQPLSTGRKRFSTCGQRT